MRECGMLLPIASLPSKYGIGCFSKEAYEFVDQLKEGGQSFWQILPLGPTGFGDSPYQAFSAFAGNPYFIDLEQLVGEGLLTEGECEEADFGDDDRYIAYDKIYKARFKVLKKAYERWKKDHHQFLKSKLDPETIEYCFYMAVKDHFKSASWNKWDKDIRLRKPAAVEKYKKMLADEIGFYEFQQFEFNEQWSRLKAYANENGIRIIGDIPIYVAFDGADSWAHPELFQFDEECLPKAVAGCPPDAFSATGQLWGNPLYDWGYHKKDHYSWWIKRMEYSLKLYDVVRVDHFRGFEAYYSIPYGDPTAEFGHWEKGPGLDLFARLKKSLKKEELPDCPVATTVQLIGNKWKLLILRNLRMRPWRFNELQKSLEGISQKVLTESLRSMEADGIIVRTVYAEVPPRVEYSLSELGETMRPILDAMEQWGNNYKSTFH